MNCESMQGALAHLSISASLQPVVNNMLQYAMSSQASCNSSTHSTMSLPTQGQPRRHLTDQFTELEAYLKNYKNSTSNGTSDQEDVYQPYRNLLALLQSVKSMSSELELKDYIRNKREMILQKQMSQSLSTSPTSQRSGESNDTSGVPTFQDNADCRQQAVKRLRTAQRNAVARQVEASRSESPQPPLKVAIIMGVSGCGKSAVGQAVADQSDWSFVDGDDYHPPENREKMACNEGLTDEDRQGWLANVKDELSDRSAKGDKCLMACSALKRKYRDFLLDDDQLSRGQGIFVYLKISEEEARERVLKRKGHFAGEGLVQSQFETLEPPGSDEAVVVVDGEDTFENVVSEVAAVVTSGGGEC